MENENHSSCGCGCSSTENKTEQTTSIGSIMTSMPVEKETEIICGPPPEPPASPFEKPGYQIQHYVEDFILTKEGYVPKIKTKSSIKDFFQTILTRSNIGRDDYKVAPGLYCTGIPDENSHILVTSNYKLSFDYLRKELTGINAWILILDTRGINVWCAAGKGTFGTSELIDRIKTSGIGNIVTHKKIILPQLGAAGISGHKVKKNTGFKVIWGPVNTKDIREFLNNNLTAEPKMREVTFTLPERAVLIPVEIALIIKPALYIIIGAILLSGFGKGFFTFYGLWERGIPAVLTLMTGLLAGAAITPLLLDKLPGVAFSVKGIVAGIAACLPIAVITAGKTGFTGVIGLLLVSISLSSYLAMNFTGSTPYTSPSGVEKEMRKAIPVQLAAIILGVILWVYSAL